MGENNINTSVLHTRNVICAQLEGIIITSYLWKSKVTQSCYDSNSYAAWAREVFQTLNITQSESLPEGILVKCPAALFRANNLSFHVAYCSILSVVLLLILKIASP